MRAIKVTFSDGDSLTTNINGTMEEITRYYVGNVFNRGRGENDYMVTAVHVEELLAAE